MDQTQDPTPRLADYRKRAGLSRRALVEQLPAQTRITERQLHRIEVGHSKTQLSTAFALAELLSDLLDERVTIDDLFPMPEEAPA